MEQTNSGLKITTETSFPNDDIKETIIEYGENFRTVGILSTEALSKSNQAVSTSNTAKDIANGATITANATAQQLETLIVESGTSDAEVIAMRTDAITGETFNTSGERLDFISKSVNDIAVGAVNLLDGGGLSVLPTWLRSANGQLTASGGIARFEVTTDGASATRVEVFVPSGVLKEKEYTLSFAYRSNVNLDIRGFVNAELLYSDTMQVTSEWKVGYFIFKSLDATASSTLRIYTSSYLKGSFIEFDYFKLERGNRYTDFSPSTNDIVSTATTTSSSKIAIANDFIRYGKIDVAKDFGKNLNLPFELYRDRDGIIKHTLDKNKFGALVNKIYLNRQNGNDSNDGTETLPVRTLTRALSLANALEGASADIIVTDKVASYLISGQGEQVYTLEKNIRIASLHDEGTVIASCSDSFSHVWTDNGNGVYSTTRSATLRVFDYKFKDFRNLPRELNKVSSLETLTAGSYFIDGNTVYVRRADNSQPDNDVFILLPIEASISINTNGKRLVIDNIHFWLNQNTLNRDALNLTGTQASEVYLFDSSLSYARFNGLGHRDIGRLYSFNCGALYNGYDGFNYHGDGDELVFEYNCYASQNGHIIRTTGNATSAHDGMTAIRVSGVYHDCFGPIIADVNACNTLIYDSVAYDSLRANGASKAAFYFDASNATAQGKAVLINCGGGGVDTYSINSDGNIPIFVKNFKGNNMNEHLKIEILP